MAHYGGYLRSPFPFLRTVQVSSRTQHVSTHTLPLLSVFLLNLFLPFSHHWLHLTSISVPRLNIFLLLRLFSVNNTGPKLLKPCGLPAHHACCRLAYTLLQKKLPAPCSSQRLLYCRQLISFFLLFLNHSPCRSRELPVASGAAHKLKKQQKSTLLHHPRRTWNRAPCSWMPRARQPRDTKSCQDGQCRRMTRLNAHGYCDEKQSNGGSPLPIRSFMQ